MIRRHIKHINLSCWVLMNNLIIIHVKIQLLKLQLRQVNIGCLDLNRLSCMCCCGICNKRTHNRCEHQSCCNSLIKNKLFLIHIKKILSKKLNNNVITYSMRLTKNVSCYLTQPLYYNIKTQSCQETIQKNLRIFTK